MTSPDEDARRTRPATEAREAWGRFGPHAILVDAIVVVWNDLALLHPVHGRRETAPVPGLGQRSHANCIDRRGQTKDEQHDVAKLQKAG